ncbi:hypothetical protein BGX38DRAFT_1266510 [Terfezia claveryi]|nr:hypothetical protein BGX38DRAFT_1266510 [Terfezia claveryi]
MRMGWLTPQEFSILDFQVGTTIDGFQGAYANSVKEPDALLQVDTDLIPSLVMEAGWSESFPKLRSDVNIWMEGGGVTKIAILVKFTKHQGNRFGAFLEVARCNAAGGCIWVNRQHLFPTPPNQTQYIAEGHREDWALGEINEKFRGKNNEWWDIETLETILRHNGTDMATIPSEVTGPGNLEQGSGI